ncbi:carboxylesterase/lipase family protein [Arthrobacter ginkgonis]|uniref:Carboxylic ester hydrolase n=1 Tax=Arthrobacter ginkgonis TaxID=1630594 RepID=A0ABP7BQQ8_9MICC
MTPTAANPIVATASGRVEGLSQEGVLSFLGIPYAGSCSGENRFLPPRPPEPWTGVRTAHAAGPTAPQLERPRHGSHEQSEDCLALNVWTPGTTGKKPVLFWMHGGGFFTGRGLTAHTDGAELARTEDVVVVSVNHRLALLGFLYLSELGGGDWGYEANPSLLDLVAALEWVRDNIAGFGGDPSNVTIFGHSGGGGKVSAILTSPLAEGLFSRAVVHGGPPFGYKDPARATEIAQRALALLGVNGNDASALRALPRERLMAVQAQLGVGAEPTDHGMLFAPVAGTASLPAFPEEALAAGVAAGIPLMTGTAIDEARFIMAGQPRWQEPDFDLDEATVLRILDAGFNHPDDARAVLDAYRDSGGPYRGSSGDSARLRLLDLMLDILSDQFAIRTHRLAAAKAAFGTAPVYSYWCTLGQDMPLGSFHGTEMPIFFRNVGMGAIPVDEPAYHKAAPVMSHALATFARTGNPNDGGVGGLVWPAFEQGEPAQFHFGDDGFDVTDRFARERLERWSGFVTTSRQDPWGRAIGESGRA